MHGCRSLKRGCWRSRMSRCRSCCGRCTSASGTERRPALLASSSTRREFSPEVSLHRVQVRRDGGVPDAKELRDMLGTPRCASIPQRSRRASVSMSVPGLGHVMGDNKIGWSDDGGSGSGGGLGGDTGGLAPSSRIARTCQCSIPPRRVPLVAAAAEVCSVDGIVATGPAALRQRRAWARRRGRRQFLVPGRRQGADGWREGRCASGGGAPGEAGRLSGGG
jgi:hypothetical protein